MDNTILGPLWAAKAPQRARKFARARPAANPTKNRPVRSRRLSAVVIRPTPRRSNEFTLRTLP